VGAFGTPRMESSKTKRIGLLTFFWEDNPGQFFQALATIQMLSEVWPDAEIELPDVRHWDQPARWWSWRDILLRPWRNRLRRTKRRKYDRARAENLPIRGPKMITDDPKTAATEIRKRGYDLVVVGSDATLYPVGKGRVHGNQPSMYWCVEMGAAKRATLSACSHNLRYECLDEVQQKILSEAVKGFSFLSVRDPLTAQLLKALGPKKGVPVQVVCDPTFSYEVDVGPAEAFWAKYGFRKQRPICGLHLPWRTPFLKSLVEYLRRDFDLVDFAMNQPGAKSLLGMGPFEWSGIFSKLDMHITTGFHDSIFCLKQGVPVFTIEGGPWRIDTKTMTSKSYYVHEEFGTLETNYFNPCLEGVTAERVYAHIKEIWQQFDGERARKKVQELGNRYRRSVLEMREVVEQVG